MSGRPASAPPPSVSKVVSPSGQGGTMRATYRSTTLSGSSAAGHDQPSELGTAPWPNRILRTGFRRPQPWPRTRVSCPAASAGARPRRPRRPRRRRPWPWTYPRRRPPGPRSGRPCRTRRAADPRRRPRSRWSRGRPPDGRRQAADATRDVREPGRERVTVTRGDQAAEDGHSQCRTQLASGVIRGRPTPARSLSTAPMIDSVAGAIARPMPPERNASIAANMMYGESTVRREIRKSPIAMPARPPAMR